MYGVQGPHVMTIGRYAGQTCMLYGFMVTKKKKHSVSTCLLMAVGHARGGSDSWHIEAAAARVARCAGCIEASALRICWLLAAPLAGTVGQDSCSRRCNVHWPVLVWHKLSATWQGNVCTGCCSILMAVVFWQALTCLSCWLICKSVLGTGCN